MNGIEKIRHEHRQKQAFVYARQSTPAQVLQHRTSTERQLNLTKLAVELGWSSAQVELVAEDLGVSGKSAENRVGFQRLAAAVGLGRVGAVFSLDAASRLARSSADWHPLIEMAALTRTLLVDEQAVYDPRDPNDRLVLGMKGTMADFELVWLRQRMDGGRWHLARKGEYRFRPPVGYVYEDDDATALSLDPDDEVRRAVALLFERYRISGTTRDVLLHFASHGLKFPARRTMDTRTPAVWSTLSPSRVHSILANPLYTGAYVYGRWQREVILDAGNRRQRLRTLSMDEWPVVIRDAHPKYIGWEEYMANQKRMSQNGPRRRGGPDESGAAREGRALLQGIVLCGRCGSRLTIRYAGQDGRYASYNCSRLQAEALDDKGCLHVQSRYVDDPVVELVLDALTRDRLLDATKVVEIVEQQDVAIEQQWKLRLERARYEAKRAERQYDACDPDNRVVARTLETRWNEKLVEVERLEKEYEELRTAKRLELSELERRRILELTKDLPRLWKEKTTTSRDRKLLLRMLIRDVSVRSVDVPRPSLRIKVLWHTQAVTEIDVDRYAKKVVSRVVSTTLPDLLSRQS
jgi:DNA invertase Pin-like site-specific DNA recombinase